MCNKSEVHSDRGDRDYFFVFRCGGDHQAQYCNENRRNSRYIKDIKSEQCSEWEEEDVKSIVYNRWSTVLEFQN